MSPRSVKPEIWNRIIAAKKKREMQRAIESDRREAMNHNICPDCGGDLVQTTRLYERAFILRERYRCKQCGVEHRYEYDAD